MPQFGGYRQSGSWKILSCLAPTCEHVAELMFSFAAVKGARGGESRRACCLRRPRGVDVAARVRGSVVPKRVGCITRKELLSALASIDFRATRIGARPSNPRADRTPRRCRRPMTAVDGVVCPPRPDFRDGVAEIWYPEPPRGRRIDGPAASWDNHGTWSGSGPGDMVVLSAIRGDVMNEWSFRPQFQSHLTARQECLRAVMVGASAIVAKQWRVAL